MYRKCLRTLLAGTVGIVLWSAGASLARAQSQEPQRFYYYPFYYFPHSYWPTQGPAWPEAPGSPYLAPPAYMAYPPFREPNWRYDLWAPQLYYRGSHFWLDQF
jgi:hypothetical protein